MYGTTARMRVKEENREKIREVFSDQSRENPKGFVATYVLMENDSDVVWMTAVFEDRAAYDANANDPAMHEVYMKYRPLLEEEPEWHDGVIEQV